MAFLPSPHFANYQQLIYKAIVKLYVYILRKKSDMEKKKKRIDVSYVSTDWVTGCVFEQNKKGNFYKIITFLFNFCLLILTKMYLIPSQFTPNTDYLCKYIINLLW